MKTIPLKFVWGIYLKLRAAGDQIRAEGGKLMAAGDKLRAAGDQIRAEGGKLMAEGDKLWAEGVIEAYGNVTIEWKTSTHCVIDGTDEYTEDMR